MSVDLLFKVIFDKRNCFIHFTYSQSFVKNKEIGNKLRDEIFAVVVKNQEY